MRVHYCTPLKKPMPFGHSSKHQLLSNLHHIILLAKLRIYAEEMTDKKKTGFSINRLVYRFVQVYNALLKPNWEALHQWKLQSHWMSLQGTKEIVSSCSKKIFKTRQQPLSIFFGFISMKFFKEHIIKNPDEVIATISCAGFTGCSAKLHKFFISPLFHKYIKGLFKNTSELPRNDHCHRDWNNFVWKVPWPGCETFLRHLVVEFG